MNITITGSGGFLGQYLMARGRNPYKVIFRLATRIRVVMGMIEGPLVPMHKIEDKGYEIENPYHPDYIKACQAAQRERVQAVFDVMTILGIELVEPVPDSTVPQLKMLTD